MTTLELLKAARKRIEDPARWTQGAYARDSFGETTFPKYTIAVKWCALGSIFAEGGPTGYAADRLAVAAVRLGKDSVTGLNDLTDHATVFRMYDLAIEAEANR